DPVARRIIDSPTFQRLRHIKQLGHAHLVYPGATHTRFDHAVGVYHLAQRALHVLAERDELGPVDEADCRVIPVGALLHDVGHYPFSHALEELEQGSIPGHHEELVGRFLAEPAVRGALESVAPDAAARVEALIRGRSSNPLQGLVSGSLDLDKIEYLKRDARFCGVPYGDVDVDRLLHSLTLLADPASGQLEVGVHEKAVAALESLLFAKYQMFRNVYWHHTVRAATVLYKRVVADALRHNLVSGEELVGATDEGLMHLLETRAQGVASGAGGSPGPAQGARQVAVGIRCLRERQLPKRAAEVVAADLEDTGAGDWLAADSALKRAVEERLATELDLPTGAVFLDYPEKSMMFGLHLLVRRRTGEVLRLGPEGRSGLIGLPEVAAELYRTARVLRVFTQGARREVDVQAIIDLAQQSDESIRATLDSDAKLLGA
ncbi:MAG TPA: HD domain-containing protein, partial [Longimicrobiales bacterium]|nr:HD domain-containing protein [Longimicrobiales bacterium]